MLKIASIAQTRQIEAAADAAGLSYAQLMQNAGRATARCVQQHLASRSLNDSARILVLVGKGNNGGDGLVAARILAEEPQIQVHCYLLAARTEDPLLHAAQQAGVAITQAADDPDYKRLRQQVQSCHVLLDALFGIGIKLPLRDPAATLLQAVKDGIAQGQTRPGDDSVIDPLQPALQKTRPHIIALDCPSGLDCDSGAIDDHALTADETITYIAAKPGLLTFPAAASVGDLRVAPIGVNPQLPELAAVKPVLTSADPLRPLLPSRSLDANKGSFGKVLIVGGSRNYRGAVGLSGRAAFRVGAGLVTVASAETIVNSLAGILQELTWLPQADNQLIDPASLNLENYDALLVGPGWGRSDTNQESLRALLDRKDLPRLVIDADGLNLLSEIDRWWELLPPETIITPHPGEMARLSGLSIKEIQADRMAIATAKSADWNLILILKGAHTVIAGPDGQTSVLPFKTDALAKAGTGDVLAGAVAGLLAQALNAYDSAVIAGFLHGLSGTIVASQAGTTRSLLAGDVIEALSLALRRIEQGV